MFQSEEKVLTGVKWHGEGTVIFSCESWGWGCANRKDFWHPDDEWEKKIKIGSRVRLWTIQYSRVIGFQLYDEDKAEWVDVWCCGNDFQTKAERDKARESYGNFIDMEGKKIATLIDEGKSLKEIDKLISDDHSGNTHACALGLGISIATNKENAEKIRLEHNKVWGVSEDKKGVVNPAVLTIGSD